MTDLQKEAIDLISRIPDDKLCYVVQLLKGVAGLSETSAPVEERNQKKPVAGPAKRAAYRAKSYDIDIDDADISSVFDD